MMKPSAHDLLFEIGAEEMPSTPLNAATCQMRQLAAEALSAARLEYEGLTVYATPRRLSLLVKGLLECQADALLNYRGPAAEVAYDDEGRPTRALEGFLRSKGLTSDQVEIREEGGTDYVYATVEQKGELAVKLLPQILTELISDLDWKRSQRWGSGDERFVRPVRWLLALYGTTPIPVRFGALQSGTTTMPHRFMGISAVTIATPNEYRNVLRGNRVIVDQGLRQTMIVEGVQAAAEPYGEARIPAGVLDEVVNLVEYPTVLVGVFDESFLRVPREILEDAMSTHQRYFAIEHPDEGARLDHHFIVVSNGDPAYNDQIIAGHERVLRARLADAAFFFDEDCKVGLSAWACKLASLNFQEKLGTMADKTARIVRLTEWLSGACGLDAAEQATVQRAAALAKADLCSSAVIEFTDLQGTMGGHYARAQGESEAVATAIAEHYQPRFSGDALPSTRAAAVLALADKADTLAGIFAIGKAPRGSSDPFGLRRAAIGIIQISLENLSLDTDALMERALAGYDALDFDRAATAAALNSFFTSRLETILRSEGFSAHITTAVLATAAPRPSDARARCQALERFVARGSVYEDLATAFTRAKNLSDAGAGREVDAALLTEAERPFAAALNETAPEARALMEAGDYDRFLGRLATMREPVDRFFEQVMVMDDDPALRRNRLALLNNFVALVEQFADFRALVA
ncbi:MAG: glycine--tRNA ligase subunit beta [Actinomycetia bacterium]|nr:glycine--tRNA ligase subunit beta [Actinomycetes bacterium]